jgi:hypothetical protein
MFSEVNPIEIDNTYGAVDIFGSWVEVGMVGIAIIAGVIIAVPAFNALLKRRKNKSKKIVNNSYIKCHTRVHEYLTELRVKLDSARTYVVQFHNGSEFLDGNSMKKMSITHESCSEGVVEIISARQGELLSLNSDFLNKLNLNDPKPFLTSTLGLCHFKRTLESNRVVMSAHLPLRDVKGGITGAICIEWCHWGMVDDLDFSVVREELIDKRRYIEAQLGDRNV